MGQLKSMAIKNWERKFYNLGQKTYWSTLMKLIFEKCLDIIIFVNSVTIVAAQSKWFLDMDHQAATHFLLWHNFLTLDNVRKFSLFNWISSQFNFPFVGKQFHEYLMFSLWKSINRRWETFFAISLLRKTCIDIK